MKEPADSMKKTRKTYSIKLETIDSIAGEVRGFLERSGVSREICLRMELVMEELLISLQREYGEDAKLDLILSKRLGRPWVTLQYRGHHFDPAEREEKDELSELILTRLGITPVWTWRGGVNRITFRLPSSGVRSEFRLLGAVVLSVLLGLCGGFLPEAVKTFLIRYLLTPVSDIFMNLLSTLAPMLIFLSILNSIVSSRSGAEFNRIGRYIVVRYLVVSVLVTMVYTAVMVPLFRFHFGAAAAGSSFRRIFDLILDIVPKNIILPFSESNMMQIIILAALFGIVILSLDNRVGRLTGVLQDLHTVFMNAVELICGALPVFVFASLLAMVWQNGAGNLAKLWKPVAAAVLVTYGHVLITAAYVSLKYRVSFTVLLKKVFPSFLIGLTAASSIAAYSTGSEINKKKLGLAASYADLAHPLGLTLYAAVYCALFLAITCYLAEIYQTAVSPAWFITLGLIGFIVTLATPQVSGGALICLSIMMTQLGIPMEGMAIAGTLALILDFFTTGAKVVGQHMEMVLQAGHLKLLSVETLRDPRA